MRARLGRRIRSAAGQTVSEYLVLTGMVTSLAIFAFNVLAGSLRETLRRAAMQILSVVTGSP